VFEVIYDNKIKYLKNLFYLLLPLFFTCFSKYFTTEIIFSYTFLFLYKPFIVCTKILKIHYDKYFTILLTRTSGVFCLSRQNDVYSIHVYRLVLTVGITLDTEVDNVNTGVSTCLFMVCFIN